MSTHPAVRRLDRDLSQMHHALAKEKQATAAAKHDAAGEKAALQKLDAREQTLIDQFTSPTAAQNPADQLNALKQMFTLGQQRANTQDTFEKKIASDQHLAAHEKALAKKDHKQALKDLKPAEYHLGLKATNRDRKELGLHAVKHVIRPEIPQTVHGQVGKWIQQAQQILHAHGVPLSKMNAKDLNIIIQHESGGNPSAQNNWDSNAAAGHPSIGLMQTIGPTFNAYKLPGHGNIRNPVDNIIAGARYAIARYGSVSHVPGVVAVHHGGAYVGY